ncbi:hypothetical protein WA026_017826 [Henosepilachna vigintioctopunctata]|uniref:BESS domain-containing protein n=1 Tax=Henosepilachna vigintioctopunctata TaxID=420089 RepID=A0AAW1TUK4_9CUCU
MEFVRSISVSQSDDHGSNIPPLSPASVASSCNEESPMDGASLNHEGATDTEAGGRNIPENKPNRPVPSGSAAEMLRHYMQVKTNKSQEEEDHLKRVIFARIEKTVRTLPPHMQIRLKFRLILKLDSQISTLVHNAELENIQTSPIHSHHNVPHPFVNNQTYENKHICMTIIIVFILPCNY